MTSNTEWVKSWQRMLMVSCNFGMFPINRDLPNVNVESVSNIPKSFAHSEVEKYSEVVGKYLI